MDKTLSKKNNMENGGDSKKQKAATLGICLLVAFVCMTVCFSNSFLYRFNDWTDANWFLSMGHGILDGKVPYKDLFEQKGVLIYMIFALACLIDGGGYLGVYLIEIVFFTAFLVMCYRILRLYKERLFSLAGVVICALITCCTAAFVRGGGAVEEYCLPLVAYGLSVYLRSTKNDGKIPVISVILCGVFAACIFWIKYTMLAFYAVFAVCVFIDRCMCGKVKTGFLYALLFVAGFAVASLPWFIYLAANGALGDMFNVYIIDNIFSYAGSKSFAQLAHDFGNTVVNLLKNIIVYIFVLLALGYVISLPDMQKRYKAFYIAIFAVFFIVQCVVYGSHLYYHLAMAVYLPLGIAGAGRCVSGIMAKISGAHSRAQSRRAVQKGGAYGVITFTQAFGYYNYRNQKISKYISCAYNKNKVKFAAVCAAVSVVLLLLCGNCTLEIFYPSSYYPQKAIASRIEEDADGAGYTMLCYKIRDGGFYTACNRSPDYYYFALNNFTREAFPELYDGQESYVLNGGADYVITYLATWEEEQDTVLAAYAELDSGIVYGYCHHESNLQWEYQQYVLLVSAK